MHDAILESHISDFSSQYEINDLPPSSQFERFVNFCIISKQYPRDFNLEDLSVGGGGDNAIDGAAIIVNGNIITDPDDIDYFIKKNGSISVSFTFIQTKKQPKFNGAQIVNFLAGIKNFFNKKSLLPENESIKELREIKDRIYKNGMSLESPPSLDLFYVTIGEWVDPDHINGLINQDLNHLESQGIFCDRPHFQCVDANRLKQMYRELRGRSLKEIEFPAIVALPEINGVRQSFVGSLAITEYIKLITDSDGNLEKSLFYDNVRDFQGGTSVNREIDKTLKTKDEQSAIAIYNNGITIIAKKIDRLGGKVKLSDFQIVNGCQTSHVLYENRNIIQGNSHLIVKIIEIASQDIAANIIKATNRQTEVKIEAFESLSPFHKDLEDYYYAKTASRKNPTYYERRSKQYDGNPAIRKNQVITLSAQIKSFVAASLWQPQSTHRYFGELLESNRERMFKQGDSFEKYYFSAAVLNRLEILFRRGFLPAEYRKFKYHLVAALYAFFTKTATTKNSIDFDKVAASIDDDHKVLEAVMAAGQTIDAATRRLRVAPRDAVRSKQLTEFLQQELNIR